MTPTGATHPVGVEDRMKIVMQLCAFLRMPAGAFQMPINQSTQSITSTPVSCQMGAEVLRVWGDSGLKRG